MNISALSYLPTHATADAAALAQDPARLAKEFDAIVVRLLLGNLGASLATDSGDSVLTQMLADQLAQSLDLGLGAALLRSSLEGAER